MGQLSVWSGRGGVQTRQGKAYLSHAQTSEEVVASPQSASKPIRIKCAGHHWPWGIPTSFLHTFRFSNDHCVGGFARQKCGTPNGAHFCDGCSFPRKHCQNMCLSVSRMCLPTPKLQLQVNLDLGLCATVVSRCRLSERTHDHKLTLRQPLDGFNTT
jgi:hypothetical protein